jgi:hypothetical protein
MLVLEAGSRAAARRRGARANALACVIGFSLGVGACARRAEAPVVVDAALERPTPPAAPVVNDAAVDAQTVAVDAQPDMAGPPRGHGHRAAPPARPSAGGFKLEGSITKADAETVLHGARGKLNVCYDKELAKNAAGGALRGRVIFRLSIDNRGRVPLAEVVTSTLGGGDPELCMVEALRDLKFPPSSTGGESTLTFPMVFGR